MLGQGKNLIFIIKWQRDKKKIEEKQMQNAYSIQKLQQHTYHEEHKYEEDANEAPVSKTSPPKSLAFTFPCIFVCHCSTPPTLENWRVRLKKNMHTTTPACCLMSLSNRRYKLLHLNKYEPPQRKQSKVLEIIIIVIFFFNRTREIIYYEKFNINQIIEKTIFTSVNHAPTSIHFKASSLNRFYL